MGVHGLRETGHLRVSSRPLFIGSSLSQRLDSCTLSSELVFIGYWSPKMHTLSGELVAYRVFSQAKAGHRGVFLAHVWSPVKRSLSQLLVVWRMPSQRRTAT